MNSTVYITNSKAKQILKEIRPVKRCSDDVLNRLYKRKVNHILSRPEMAALQTIRDFYDQDNFSMDVYQKIDARPEKGSMYVFNSKKSPSYHRCSSCSALTSTFENYMIPAAIKARGEEEVEKFRSFFIENLKMLRDKPDVFHVKLKSTFHFKDPVEHVCIDNSGIHEMENLDLQELEEKIDRLLIDAEAFKAKDKETEKIIRDKGYGTHKELRICAGREERKKEYETLYEWHSKYKGGLKYLLGEYFRVKLNPELKFESLLLDQLGFVPCKKCN